MKRIEDHGTRGGQNRQIGVYNQIVKRGKIGKGKQRKQFKATREKKESDK